MKEQTIAIEFINDDGSCTITKSYFYNSLLVVASYTSKDELLGCRAYPLEGATMEQSIIDCFKLIRSRDNDFESVNLVIGEKQVAIDKQSAPKDVFYELKNYDEIYETAPEHLK